MCDKAACERWEEGAEEEDEAGGKKSANRTKHTTSIPVNSTMPQKMIEGGFKVKLPTIWTDGRAEAGQSEKRREAKKEESQKKEDPGALKR